MYTRISWHDIYKLNFLGVHVNKSATKLVPPLPPSGPLLFEPKSSQCTSHRRYIVWRHELVSSTVYWTNNIPFGFLKNVQDMLVSFGKRFRLTKKIWTFIKRKKINKNFRTSLLWPFNSKCMCPTVSSFLIFKLGGDTDLTFLLLYLISNVLTGFLYAYVVTRVPRTMTLQDMVLKASTLVVECCLFNFF